MKRRPGVERRRRRLAQQITGGKSSVAKAAYMTYNFEKKVAQPMYNKEGKEIYAADYANRAGFYFEACFYKAFCYLVGQPYDESALNTNQKQAIYNFNNAKIGPDSKKTWEDVRKLGAAVEQSAALAAKAQYDNFVKKFQKLNEKKYTIKTLSQIKLPEMSITNIATEDGKGVGNIMGDMKVIVNGEEHILELKWQSSPYAATRYFGPVSDETLFQGGFAAWLRDRKDDYWDYSAEGSFWSDKLAFKALPLYMNDRFGDAGAMINYLLAKGNINDGRTSSFNNTFSTKAVVHANYTGIMMQGLPELAERLRNAINGVAVGTKVKEALVFIANGSEEAATFGLASFRNQRNIKSENSPGPDVFSFQFYIAQKYVGMMK